MSEKKSKAQRVMVTEEDMGDHTKIAIPSEIGNHFVGLGARFGVYSLYQINTREQSKAAVDKILEAHGMEIPVDENGDVQIDSDSFPDEVQEAITQYSKDQMKKFLLSPKYRTVMEIMRGIEDRGDLFEMSMGFNNMAQMCIEEMREEGLIESDDDEEAELVEAEPQSEYLN